MQESRCILNSQEIFLWIRPKKEKKDFFLESLDQCRRLELRENARNVFLWLAYVCLTTRCYTTSHFHQVFFDFARIFSLFLVVFCTSRFWSLRNLIKQLFHWRLLDMKLVIANSYPTHAYGIIVNKYSTQPSLRSLQFNCTTPNLPIVHWVSRQFLSTVVWGSWAMSEPKFSLGFNFEVKNYYL